MGQAKYAGTTKKVNGRAVWTGKISLDEKALQLPLKVKKPTTWFVNSMSDLFHADVPEEFIVRVFKVMRDSRQHTFQILTKRPKRMRKFVNNRWTFLPHNIWVGVSVEDQAAADERVPELLKTLAAVRFLSVEPMLGPVNLGVFPMTGKDLHWVICGGESGTGARPMRPEWARAIRDQCQAAGVAFFFKQWGAWAPYFHVRDDLKALPKKMKGKCGTFMGNAKSDLRRYQKEWQLNLLAGDGTPMVLVGKKVAGRLLDGVEWNEMPWRNAEKAARR